MRRRGQFRDVLYRIWPPICLAHLTAYAHVQCAALLAEAMRHEAHPKTTVVAGCSRTC